MARATRCRSSEMVVAALLLCVLALGRSDAADSPSGPSLKFDLLNLTLSGENTKHLARGRGV